MVKLPLDGRDNVEGGLLFRNKDAAALYAGYQWNNFMLGMSYDVNLSGVTGGPGAFELTLTYIPKAKEKKEPSKKKEKDKKSAPKAKPSTTKAKSSVPTSGPKPSAATSAAAPKTQEKTVPDKKPSSSTPKSVDTTKPSTSKPTSKTVVNVKPPVSTVPSNTTSKTNNPSAKVITPNEKLEVTKANLKSTQKLSIPAVILSPKKSGKMPSL
ncbi:MAG: type IX secretion system membrane protein PorP/SprF [Bacteroidetes bacterium]|nr:type IX secretion system membrane protein PorP/SprF [Bacteroidota bacterium]